MTMLVLGIVFFVYLVGFTLAHLLLTKMGTLAFMATDIGRIAALAAAFALIGVLVLGPLFTGGAGPEEASRARGRAGMGAIAVELLLMIGTVKLMYRHEFDKAELSYYCGTVAAVRVFLPMLLAIILVGALRSATG